MIESSVVPFSEVSSGKRWDSEFYSPNVTGLVSSLEKAKSKPLGHFIESARRGQAPDYDSEGTVPVLRSVNIRDLEFSDTRQEFVSQGFLEDTPNGVVRKLDFTVTSTGVGTLGRVFCNLNDSIFFADGHITILTPKYGMDCAYLSAVLQSQIGRIQLERWQRGSSGQIEIYPEDILQILIPVLPDQLREKVSSLWTNAVELVDQSKNDYPEAEQALLDRMSWEGFDNFSDELVFVEKFTEMTRMGRSDPEHFQPKYQRLRKYLVDQGAVRIEDLCLSIDKGTQPGIYVDDGDVIVVKSKDVFGRGIDFENCERTTLESYDDVASRLDEGDLVFNATGLGTLGRAAFIPATNDKIIASVDLLILRLNQEEILPEYAALFLNSPAGLAQSDMFQTGSSGQVHLYPQHIQEFLLFLPRNRNGKADLVWQRDLSDRVSGASQSKKKAQKLLTQAKELVEQFVEQKGWKP